jgi:hypothetical protein
LVLIDTEIPKKASIVTAECMTHSCANIFLKV